MSSYKMSGTTVVSFSGDRSSDHMLRQVLEANDDLDDLIVTFANTGKQYALLPFTVLIRRWPSAGLYTARPCYTPDDQTQHRE